MSSQKNQGESRSVPDLYKLLGLQPVEKDPAVILARIERLETKAANATDEKRAKQARKVASVARKQLCDPKQKKNYDAAWRKTYAGPSQAVTAARDDLLNKRVAGSPELNPQFTLLLPTGSPEAAFDLAAYARNPSVTRFDPTQFSRLFEAVQDAGRTAQSQSGFASETAPAAVTEPSMDRKSLSTVPPVQSSPVASTHVSPALGSRLRSKRKKSVVLPIVGLLVCMVVVLGLVAYLVRPADDSGPIASRASSSNSPPRAPSAPRRSGLPQVQGLGNELQEAGGKGPGGENTPEAMPMSGLEGLAGEVDADTMYGMPEQPREPPASMDLTAAEPGMGMAASTDFFPMENGSSAAAMPPEQAGPPIDDALVTAGELASKYEYDAALEKLQVLSAGQLSANQRAQVERVDTLVGLAQQAHASLKSTLSGMSAGETFLVGTSAQVAVVSADDQKIAIRLRGQPREYTYDALPPGMLYSLLDLSLDSINPTARGAKGAFILLQPNRNGRSIGKAREHLVAAVASGAFRDDLLSAVEDLAIE